MFQKEEAREQLKAKTTDTMMKPNKGQNAVIDDKPIFVGSRVSLWEKTIQERNEDVKRNKWIHPGTGGAALLTANQPEQKAKVEIPVPAAVKMLRPIEVAATIVELKQTIKPPNAKIQ